MIQRVRDNDVRLSQNPKDKDVVIFEKIELTKKDGDPDLIKEFEKLEYQEWITYPIPYLDPQKQKKEYSDAQKKAIELYGDEVYFDLPVALFSENSLDNDKIRRKYEIFCGGFLFYHDLVFKKYRQGKGYTDENGKLEWKEYEKDVTGPDGKKYKTSAAFEHKIYFEWLPRDKNITGEMNRVRIYINKTPKEFNADPPPPKSPPPPESNP